MKNSEVIYDALSWLGVVSETEALTAEQAALGLRRMNDLLAEWSAVGIDIGHWPQTDPSADFPAGPTVAHAMKSNLAVVLAPDFTRPVPAAVILMAGVSYQRMLRDAVSAQMEPADLSHLPRAENGGFYDVVSDEFN